MPSIEDIPQYLADYWNISLESAQIVLSISVLFTLLLPVLYLTKGRGLIIPAVIFFLAEALLVGIGWLSAWVMLVTILIMALLWAKENADMVTGG